MTLRSETTTLSSRSKVRRMRRNNAYSVGGNANNLSSDGTFSIFNTHNTTWNALQLKNLHGNGSNKGTADIIGDVVASNGQIARGRIQFRERTNDSPNSEIAFFTSADTNTDPTKVNFPIPSNDDATKSISCILSIVEKAISEGLEERELEKDKKATEKKDKAKKIVEEKKS